MIRIHSSEPGNSGQMKLTQNSGFGHELKV
jgi:hypothetical protein